MKNRHLERVIEKLDLSSFKNQIESIESCIIKLGWGTNVTDSHQEIDLADHNFFGYEASLSILVNPNTPKLDGDNHNWIWGFMHELGHLQDDKNPRKKSYQEFREVQAWENAAVTFGELNFDNSLKTSFKQRAIKALRTYWQTPNNQWKNTYSWHQEYDKLIPKPILRN